MQSTHNGRLIGRIINIDPLEYVNLCAVIGVVVSFSFGGTGEGIDSHLLRMASSVLSSKKQARRRNRTACAGSQR